MSFDTYMQIIFSTIVPAIIALAVEIRFSGKEVRKKYIVGTFGIWLIVFTIITVIYFSTKQDKYEMIDNEYTSEDITTDDYSQTYTNGISDVSDSDSSDTPSETDVSYPLSEEKPETITSTDFDLDNPLVDKVDKLVSPSNPVRHDIQIIFTINSSSYPEEEIGIYNNDKEKELLYKAKELYENKNYDEAIAIYVCDELKDNPYAQINIGYLYAHGYGYDEDIEAALNIYDSINLDIAKRNKLALLITSNKDGKNDAEIKILIDYFINKNDYYVQNYISNCLYSKNIEALNDREKNIICDLKELYILELTETINSTKTYYLSQAYKKLVFTGSSYHWNENHVLSIYYHYNVFQYMYLDLLDKIYA